MTSGLNYFKLGASTTPSSYSPTSKEALSQAQVAKRTEIHLLSNYLAIVMGYK